LPVLKVQGVLDTDAPDPAVLRVGDRWYAYSTQVGFTAVPVRWSDDLVTWSAPQDALPTLPVWASGGWNWAPSVVATDDGYVLWFVARDIASDRQCVSRAVATDPMGPFVDDSAEAPVCQADVGGSIDPDVFTDDDGQRYLTWKSDENAIGQRAQLWVAPLSADATTLTAPGQAVLAEDASWEVPTIEQPALVREGDIYYLFYSGGAWESDGYGIGYATGASPTGPFTKRTRTRAWVRSAAGRYGPGALDVFEGPAGARWAVFHAWPGRVGYAAGGWRSMRVGSLDLP
jgi:beta-xylosidase